MARFYPATPPADIESSELKVWRALQLLSDEWRIFHSVRWQSIRGGKQGDGEADFLLLHKAHGLTVLEVKGGGISVIQGRWFSTNNAGSFEIKDPFEQAISSKYTLLHHLKNLRPPVTALFVGHAVAFPDVTLDTEIGMVGPRAIILDARDLRACAEAVARVVAHWNRSAAVTNSELERITALLAPTLTVKRTLRDQVHEASEQIIVLTAQQVSVLGHLRWIRKAIVFGGAGTGKTILAREKARQLSMEGLRVLLTCFNAQLARNLKSELEGHSGIRVSTFHALCNEEARKRGIPVPAKPSAEWWEQQAPEILVSAAADNGTLYDCIVVDEGQDFASHWIRALLTLTAQPLTCAFYIFADMHQDLFSRKWQPPPEWPTFMLDLNCRSTIQIARRVDAVYSDSPTTSGAQGPEPVFLKTDLASEGIAIIQQSVQRLLDEERLGPHQIAVLSDDWNLISQLRETGVAQSVFCEPGRLGIATETVARFKGLEADAIVLALSDRMVDLEDRRATLYVALSRARVILQVLGSGRTRKALGW
jgi:superfamily I DNA and RNA helicase